MARRTQQGLARLSLIDALVEGDDAGSDSTGRRLRRLKENVRRDLQDLLNSRQRCIGWDSELEELKASVLDYGVPDLTGTNLASQERRAAFLRELEATIRRHDPRFQSVKVQSTDNTDPYDRTLRFRIEGTLRIESGAEQAVFDFMLEPVTRHFE